MTKKFDVVYAVSVTRWKVVEQVEAENEGEAERTVRQSEPSLSDAEQNTVVRVVAHPQGSPIARRKQTNTGPVFADGDGI